MKRSYTSSIRRSKRGQREKGNLSGSSCTIGSVASRKTSGMTNTSGASILYPGRMTTKDRRLLKMILVIFVSFVTCYLPITSTKIIRSFHNIHGLQIMAYILIYLTPCVNPIIYVVSNFKQNKNKYNENVENSKITLILKYSRLCHPNIDKLIGIYSCVA